MKSQRQRASLAGLGDHPDGEGPDLLPHCVLGEVPEPGRVIAASAPAPAIPDRTDAEGQQ
jgi:hypothetical protein